MECNNVIKTGQESKVYVCTNNSKYSKIVIESLQKFKINFELTNSINRHDNQNLYIIFDVFNIQEESLPKYYITYQSLDLTNNQLTIDYVNKLTNSIAVWDYSPENINRYRSILHNYLYMPANYEHTDPVILPCLMPISALDTYKELLIYSNQKDTDISSHLPTLFCHTMLQNPKIIVEAGVRGGESTKPLHKAAQLCDACLIGLDNEPLWAQSSYNTMDNAFCLEMNDLDFNNYYNNSSFKDQKIDLIFIDTSHEYEHTLQEIKVFAPLLANDGTLAFHDSNVTPLAHAGYIRLNFTGDRAAGNPRGVPQAIKEYFGIEFNEYSYFNGTFMKDGITWHMIHYPFCNGLTIIKKQSY